MGVTCLLCAILLTPGAPETAGDDPNGDGGGLGGEPEGGAGVSPIEIVPRIELRQSFVRLSNGAAVNDTTFDTGFQFTRRLLLQYQMPYRVLSTPAGQVSGVGDVQTRVLGLLTSDPERLVVLLLGWVLNSASQPALGAGKQQLVFGAGAAIKPRPFWIAYGVAQQQLSIAGSAARPDVNQLDLLLGSILFGWQYNWIKAELDTRLDFADGAGQLFGTVEAGALLIGRVGLFVRAGTQLAGSRQIDYALAAGLRYLFRLEGSAARPS